MALPPVAPIDSRRTPPKSQNALLGIALMSLSFFIFAAVDAMAKYLTSDFHPMQVAWTRQLGLLVGIIVILGLRGPALLRSAKPKLQLARGALAGASATLFIMAVQKVPLADAVAVTFVAPFFATILGALLLQERVGTRRWIAVAIGFVGMLIVVRPGLGAVHPAVLIVLAAALMFALRQIVSRAVSGSDSTLTTVAYTALTSGALLSLPLPFIWTTPETLLQLALLGGTAILAALGEVLVIRALELAEVVVLAPLHYSMILWGTFYGWLVFDQLPDGWTLLGAAIIIATGLYTIHRERVAGARKPAPAE